VTEILNLEKVLVNETWSKLHPATKLIVKIIQHVRDKLNDGAEVRIFYDEEKEDDVVKYVELKVTTCTSEITITKEGVEFMRKRVWESQNEFGFNMRVQRVRVRLPAEAVKMIKNVLLDLIEGVYTVDMYDVVVKFEEYIALARAAEEFVKFAKQMSNCPSCARPTRPT
jgi:hypothetical protein